MTQALPTTIRHPKTFQNSPPAGYDGVFDWSWTAGCFGGGRITPMDIDGVVERKGQFLVFETKNMGVPIPKGQLYTLERLHRLNCFTIMIIYGKQRPETCECWYPGTTARRILSSKQEAIDFVANWYRWADQQGWRASQ